MFGNLNGPTLLLLIGALVIVMVIVILIIVAVKSGSSKNRADAAQAELQRAYEAGLKSANPQPPQPADSDR